MADDEKLRTYLRRVTADLHKARQRLRATEEERREPIAIVGMGCRYPGGVRSAEQLWDLVVSGQDAISGFPTDRGWDLDALYDPHPESPDTIHVREGGFVYDVGEFDAGFFGISPREALLMDPQQRLLLEASWEALEYAGIDASTLKGSQTGVFAGTIFQDYDVVTPQLRGHGGAVSLPSIVSGRVAYTFGLEGPAITVDTACSSSLVAMHLACQALRTGECSLALAGGVTVMATPGAFVGFSLQQGLARDARCKSFAAAADGTSLAEGVGVLVMERLSDARRWGHPVLAVVKGSAVNQDGASNGLMAPNGPSQQRVIRQALANADLSTRQVDVVEAHGTGTTLGDPIEAQALLATYGQNRSPARPLWLGSVKSNIGHAQAAAGVAGVIKMVMAFRHGVIPKTLHVDRPSGQVDWTAGAVSLLTDAVPWKTTGDEPRRAGVSSFGASGTNAHLLLEEAHLPVEDVAADGGSAPSVTAAVGGVDPRESEPTSELRVLAKGALAGAMVPWVVSARSGPALRGQAARLAERVDCDVNVNIVDVGYSLAAGRAVLANRAVAFGTDRAGLQASVDALAHDGPSRDVVRGVARSSKLAFLFPGQGSQWAGMAVDLWDASPAFGAQMEACGDALRPLVDWSLADVVRGADGAPGLERVDVVQPVLFAVMVSLAGLWRVCGVNPDVVIGHSQGEIAAACVAGGLSLQDAACLAVLRSRALARLAGGGGMVAVALASGELERCIERWGNEISIAAVNGPASVVVAGEREALEHFLLHCNAEGVRARRIPVDYAAHSPQVATIREELLAACSTLAPRAGDVPFYSSVTGGVVDTATLDAEYWYRNLRDAVQFERATLAALDAGCRRFIEISPHSVLTLGVGEACEKALGDSEPEALITGTLRRGQGGLECFARALAEVFVDGGSVDWPQMFAGSEAEQVPLPTYAFQRDRYWLDQTAGTVDMAAAGQSATGHPLLAAAVQMAGEGGWLFTGRLSLATHPWLADHAAMGVVLLPGTAFMELALYAGRQLESGVLRELTIEVPLVVTDSGVQIQLVVGDIDEAGQRTVAIYSHPAGGLGDGVGGEQEWTRHAMGNLVGVEYAQDAMLKDDPSLGGPWPVAGARPLEFDDLYERLAELGYDYGPAFLGLRAAWQRGDEVFAEVALPAEQGVHAGSFGLHPALLDAALQAAVVGALDDDEGGGQAHLPFFWGGVTLHATGASSARVRIRRERQDTVSLVLADEAGGLIASIDAVVAREVSVTQLGVTRDDSNEPLYRLGWTLLATDKAPTPGSVGHCVVVGEHHSALTDALQRGGMTPAVHADVEALRKALDEGVPVPQTAFIATFDDTTPATEHHMSNKKSSGRDGANHAATDTDEAPRLIPAGDMPESACLISNQTLRLVQQWLSDERLASCRLVVVSSGALAARPGEDVAGLAQAPVWGLMRSAQSEHPGRVSLIDIDRSAVSWSALPGVLDIDEPQLAIREGGTLIPRLERIARQTSLTKPDQADEGLGGEQQSSSETAYAAEDDADHERTFPFDPQGTTLITGGTGELGALVARHLVVKHGVCSLVLVSRRGRKATGARELERELTALGARVIVVACDIGDREQLKALLKSIPDDAPLNAIVHTAAVLADGLIESLTPEDVNDVLRPKVHAAWYLHELTAHLPLSAFILFSSVAATFGSPGVGNYAAGNAFLDALAQYRRARGLPGIAMAWGHWGGEATGIGANLRDADLARMRRSGVSALPFEECLRLFDMAQGVDEALVVPVRLDIPSLRAHARAGIMPSLLRSLVRMPLQQAKDGTRGSLARRLAGLSASERERVVLEVVSAETATVLGHSSPLAIDATSSFKALGFDSLTALELRHRLSTAAELRLPATLVFDYPTPAVLASHLLEALRGVQQNGRSPVPSAVTADEPIAIVGMSCRYPGGVQSPEDLWKLVASGGDAISTFPTDRGWDVAGLYDPDPDRPGTTYVREGGFVYDAGEFDAGFFGISPREALAMDPQQRLLLEASWEALEDAGIDPSTLRGSETGVYAGISSQDYGLALVAAAHKGFEGYLGTGSSGSVVSGRVAYAFGFEGPAVTVDTACSSSLVALHLACGALRAGECSLALASGVTVLSSSTALVAMSSHRGLSPDGRCKSFAAAADGTGLSEGVGVVLLERLSDAFRLNHHVLAVVSGSAVNQDGASNGLTAPNGPSQQRVIRQALANARVLPSQVAAVEAHGTGTMLGDPIEAHALLATYGQDRMQPLRLGSIKSNIGHTQAAAGIAGVIKMVMALRHDRLPMTLHVDEPSTQIDWSAGKVSLLIEAEPWERNGEPRRAAVSSFGISGTNAHVIIEDAPSATRPVNGGVAVADASGSSARERAAAPLTTNMLPWVISGRDRAALRDQVERLHAQVSATPALGLADIGFSLASTRAALEHRAVVLGEDHEGLLGGLRALATGETAVGVVEGAVGGDRIVFVFPGNGSQWSGMALELLSSSAVFADHVQKCCDAFEPHLDWSLYDVLHRQQGAPPLDQIDVIQPVLFTVMTSLAELWRAFGVLPAAVIGHSQGEVAAAYVAGGLLLQDAARLVALRGKVLAGLTGNGRMVSLSLGVEELTERLKQWDGGIVIAAVNGPSSIVVSGEPDLVQELLQECATAGIHTREIPAAVGAGHSPQVEAFRKELLEAGSSVVPRSSKVAFHSTVTGGVVDTAELDAEYWYRNARETVQFDETVRTLLKQGYGTFVEVSPHPVLATSLSETIEKVLDEPGRAVVAGTLRRGEGGPNRFLNSLADLWVRGVPVDWSKLFEQARACRVTLPTYAFQRKRYWLAGDRGHTGDMTPASQESANHPLLSTVVELAGGDALLFTGSFSLQTHPWLADHSIMGVVVLPGAVWLELALHAGGRVGCEAVHELTLETQLVVPEEGSIQLQVSVGAAADTGRRTIAIYSRCQNVDGERLVDEEKAWTRNATGVLAPVGGAFTGLAIDDVSLSEATTLLSRAWPPQGAKSLEVDEAYDRLAELGAEYGPAFQGLRAAWRWEDKVLAEVSLSEEQEPQAAVFNIHPVLLDAALHARGSTRAGPGAGEAASVDGQAHAGGAAAQVPFSWKGVELHNKGVSTLRVCLSPVGEDEVAMVACDESGALLASVNSVALRTVSEQQPSTVGVAAHKSLFRVQWIPLSIGSATTGGPRSTPSSPLGRIALIDSDQTMPVEALSTSEVSSVAVHRDLAALGEALDCGQPIPDVVLAVCAANDCSSDPMSSHRDPAVAGVVGSGGLELGGAVGTRIAAYDLAEATHRVARTALSVVQSWLGDGRFANSRLVFVTRSAVAVNAGSEVPSLAEAPVWGLVRSAQAEHPGRLLLVDVDGRMAAWRTLAQAVAVALELGESQLAVREEAVLVPRLVRVTRSPAVHDDHASLDAHAGPADVKSIGSLAIATERTVLITGGTGNLGALVARHLVITHRVRHLLLVSRRGPNAPGARDLASELGSLGAEVNVAACDVGDRDQLEALLASVDARHPLGGVIHTSALLEDGAVELLSPESMDRVLTPKVDAALHLHELTEHMQLSMFVLFSSAAATLGSPGQGSYAAANAFLDSLAAQRRAQGLAGISMAWGLWAQAGDTSGAMSQANRTRIARLGLAALSVTEGLELFDLACSSAESLVVPAYLDMPALRAAARAGMHHSVLRSLIRVPTSRVVPTVGRSLLRRLASAPAAEREAIVRQAVLDQIAAVLGHDSSDAIDAHKPLLEMGFDSLAALELRNRLNLIANVPIPVTAMFDRPTPAALACYLNEQLGTQDGAAGDQRSSAPEQASVAPPLGGDMAGTIGSMLRTAHELGSLDEFVALLTAASKFRPTFAAPQEADGAPRPVELCIGARHPELICIPTVVALSGPHQYVKLAQCFSPHRRVSALAVPGFGERELLPATVAVAVATLANAVRQHSSDVPFVLVGYSSGGWLAHAIASHLETIGVFPAGVVLLDTYPPHIATMSEVLRGVVEDLLTASDVYMSVSDDRLVTMGAYLRLLADWQPAELASPILLVRATEPMPGMATDSEWRASWLLTHTLVDVPGNHFTMMEEHVKTTAEAIHTWLPSEPED